MYNKFFDVISIEEKDIRKTLCSFIPIEQANDYIISNYPEHLKKMKKTISPPYILITNENYCSGNEIRRIYYQWMW